MDKQRVFLAIPIPETIKQAISSAIAKDRLSFRLTRWIPEQNWHITVMQPQYWDEDEIRCSMDVLQDSIRQKPFLITLQSIVLGPNQRNPRMIWVQGAPNKEYASLLREVRSILQNADITLKITERDEDIIHMTLARFPPIFGSRLRPVTLGDSKGVRHSNNVKSEGDISYEPLPSRSKSAGVSWEDKLIKESFMVDHMELWHVDLKPTGAEYTSIGGIQLTNDK